MRISEARGFKIGAADAVALYAGASKLWPVAPAGIVPVQRNILTFPTIPSSFFVPFNDTTPTTTAHAGALLTAAWAGYNARTPIVDPSWTNQGNVVSGNNKITIFSKISDGTETGITFSQSGTSTTGCAGAVIEWPVGMACTVAFGQSSFASGASSTPSVGFTRAMTFSAPPKAGCVPLIMYAVQTQPTPVAPNSPPWIGEYENAGTLDSSVGYCYAPARDTGDTVILTRSSGTTTNPINWSIIWILPP